MLTFKINHILKSILGKDAKIISKLSGGMMNLSFLVEDKNKQYVLYISTKQANEMVNRPLEKANHDIIHDLGVTCRNVYFDSKRGIKLNEYIVGESLNHVDSWDYQKVADILKILHSSKILSKEDYQPFKRLKAIIKEADQYIKERSNSYIELQNFLFEHKEYLEKQSLSLCHNDYQRSNIIKTDADYKMIDFEFCANNDPIYDIAAFGNNNVSEGRKLLDVYYKNKPTKDQIKRFYLWRIFLSLQWHNVAITKHYRREGKKHNINFLDVSNFFLSNALEAYNKLNEEI